MCDCHSYNRDAGDTPEVALDPNPYFPFGQAAGTVCVDACIAPQITALWKAGIWTLGSCCGHGERGPSVVISCASDADKAARCLSVSDGRDWDGSLLGAIRSQRRRVARARLGIEMSICRECGKPLTREEAHYYESRCEGCERDWLEAIEDWRHGRAEIPEFDRLYGAQEKGKVVH